MAVRVVRPKDWEEAELVEVESNASSNPEALVEIEEWASLNGLFRTSEGWLRMIADPERGKVFRSICYRPYSDELQMIETRILNRDHAAARL